MAGDVLGLAPLVWLTYLYLDKRDVAGDVEGREPLVRLTRLDLTATRAAGQFTIPAHLDSFSSHRDVHALHCSTK